MAEKRPEYDVYDPEVRAKLVAQLLPPLRIWGEGEHHHLPEAFPHYERDLIAALDYAGSSLDGYSMARFLEENCRWPSDHDLVAILALSKELVRKSKDAMLCIGDVFVDSRNIVYEIVDIRHEAMKCTLHTREYGHIDYYLRDVEAFIKSGLLKAIKAGDKQ